MKPTMLFITLTLLMALGPTRGLAQEPRWQQELEALKTGQQAMQKELQDIQHLVRALCSGGTPTPPQHVVLTVADASVKGEPTATVTLVEFTDFQCPFCSKFVHDTFPHLDAEYIKTGKVKYVRKDLPLESIHPHAFKAAEATRCAQEQGKGWEMHARLFSHQHQLALAHLPEHAHAVGIDTTAFQHCVDSGKYAARIRQDMREAQGAGVTGTPSFFFGRSDPDGQVTATRSLAGAQAYSAFKAAIDALLQEQQ